MTAALIEFVLTILIGLSTLWGLAAAWRDITKDNDKARERMFDDAGHPLKKTDAEEQPYYLLTSRRWICPERHHLER